jgi:hypothetical protein
VLPAERSVERLRFMPDIGDQDLLASSAESFFDFLNQADCDTLMAGGLARL